METREVYVTLSQDERDAKSRALAANVEKIAQEKLAAKNDAQVHATRLKELATEQADLARCVTSGKERRPVPVVERKDPRRFCVETVRVDTMEVIDTRAFDEDEIENARQGHLFAAATADSTDAPPAPPADGDAPAAGADGQPVPEAPESAVNAVGMTPDDAAALADADADADTGEAEGDPADPATEISDPASILDAAAPDGDDADA